MRSIDMPSARITCNSSMRPLTDGREMQAVSNVVESQILSRLTYYKYCNFGNQACFSLPSSLQQSMGSGENGKRYQLHQPASSTLDQAGRTLSLQSNHINSASLPASDYNNGATLIPSGMVRIHFFL
ncbi:hypothetical protein [Duganella sp. BJB1802]|uniref:hypothetical protein n=1 Tax=Duganella sp. BJB1802 TaxID=2744575 RepID=UPI001C3D889B|nr:hypothetical protein [Duganella sp. BJB1802]